MSVLMLSLVLLNPNTLTGVQWNALDDSQRQALAAGIILGNTWTAAALQVRGADTQDVRDAALAPLDTLSLVKMLDTFYADDANALVRIGLAVMRLRGFVR